MQDQYFGDINDYRKYGLLRCLCEAGLHVGVCWMKTPSDASGQGGRVNYLDTPHKYRSLDPELFDFLKNRVQIGNRRAIRELEAASETLLPGATFFSETLPAVAVAREAYFNRAAATLRTADVIFFDPDIGLAPPSAGQNSEKHLYWHEVDRVASGRASVVIFWNRPQAEPWSDFLARGSMELRSRIPKTSVYAIRSAFVAFFIACQAAHRERFMKAMALVRQRWTGDMKIVQQTESVPSEEGDVPMNEDDRFQMLEGKIWALARLLAGTLDASGMRDARLEALIAQARRDYPATCDPKHPVGIGFDEIVNHIRARGTTQPPSTS